MTLVCGYGMNNKRIKMSNLMEYMIQIAALIQVKLHELDEKIKK